MRPFFQLLLYVLLIHAEARGEAPQKVVTTLTDLAWAARVIGKKHVEVTALLSGSENPHYVDTIPDFIRLVADASVVCIAGLDLEIGWMPKVLSRSGNAQVQPGGKGYCDTGSGVSVLDRPTGKVDRSMGDIHPMGNPHFWLSPKWLLEASTVIRDTLIKIDPAHTADYQNGYRELSEKLEALIATNREKLNKAFPKRQGPVVMEYHKEFSYFFDVYSLNSMGSIEEKPGVPPSAGRIAEVALAAKSAGIKVALCGEYAPEKTMRRFKEISGIPYARLQTALHSSGGIGDYIDLQNHLVDTVVKSLRNEK